MIEPIEMLRNSFTKYLIRGFLALILCVTSFGATAQEIPSSKADLQDFIRNYLLDNPEILVEALDIFEQRRREEAVARQQRLLSEKNTVLTSSDHQVVLGNPDGEVTLVEFFDYNCGFCRRTLADIERLLSEDKNLKIVLKEFPVLGEGSVQAARVGVALSKIDPDKYHDFHKRVLSSRGQVNGRSAMVLATRSGYDEREVRVMMAKPEINEAINEVYGIAQDLGLTGTPTFVIGTEILPGAVGYDVLRQKIDAMRQCGNTVCS